MKHFTFIIWLILTVVLTCSVIGLLVLVPQNTGQYIHSQESTRSTWMRIGFKLLNDL